MSNFFLWLADLFKRLGTPSSPAVVMKTPAGTATVTPTVDAPVVTPKTSAPATPANPEVTPSATKATAAAATPVAPATSNTPAPASIDPLTPLQRMVAKAIVQVFETGKYSVSSYGSVTVAKGDTGGLSYGSHQATRASGALFRVVDHYILDGGTYASELRKYLTPLANKDSRLDHDQALIALLKKAGSDPIMRKAQEDYFDEKYWDPSAAQGKARGFKLPISYAVIFDGNIHGSFKRIADRVGRQPDELTWVKKYVAERKHWLGTHSNSLLRKTVYRMETFEHLLAVHNYDLNLPLSAHGFLLKPEHFRV